MIKQRLRRFIKQIAQIVILVLPPLAAPRLLAVAGYWLLVTASYAQPISSSELINNAKQYDGKAIVYQGEIIGDLMPRGENAWINLHDGNAAIGVFVDRDKLPAIKFIGGYQKKGDILKVEGIFHASCIEHGGNLDIHAQKIFIQSPGYDIIENISPLKIKWAKNFSYFAIFLFVCVVIKETRGRWKKK